MLPINMGIPSSVIDGQTNTVIGGPIPVGVGPVGIIFNPDNGDMYVADADSRYFHAVNTDSTPSESIENLIDTINDLDISKHAKAILTAPLKIAVKLLTDNNLNLSNQLLCRILDAFLIIVHSMESNKQLTSLQTEQLASKQLQSKQFRM